MDNMSCANVDLYYDGFEDNKQLEKSFESYFLRNNKEGLRDIVAQGIGIFALLRSGDQRRVDLSEMSSRLYEQQGPTPALAVVISTRESKTNQHGKVQYAAFFRHKNVFVCPVFFLSIYLFCR